MDDAMGLGADAPPGQDVAQDARAGDDRPRQEPRSQLGALCWREHRGRIEVLLITSRDTGRWIVPKGWPMQGRAPEAAAAREAWEEAGVRGDIRAEALGLYSYDKVIRPGHSLPCVVVLYPLRVGELAHRYPERKERRRKWFAAEKAARKVDEPELRALLSAIAIDPRPLTGVAAPVAAG